MTVCTIYNCVSTVADLSEIASESLHNFTILCVVHNYKSLQQCFVVDKRTLAIVRQRLNKDIDLIGCQRALMFREHTIDALQNFFKLLCQDVADALVIEVEAPG